MIRVARELVAKGAARCGNIVRAFERQRDERAGEIVDCLDRELIDKVGEDVVGADVSERERQRRAVDEWRELVAEQAARLTRLGPAEHALHGLGEGAAKTLLPPRLGEQLRRLRSAADLLDLRERRFDE